MDTFTENLRSTSEPTWTRSVDHRFVHELADGTLSDEVMAAYLIQDYRFLDSFLTLLGAAIATADTFDARARLARFVGDLAGDENTYFLRAFDALGITEAQRADVPDWRATEGLKNLHRDAADSRDYAAILAVLVVSEWLYLDWANRIGPPRTDNFVHTEWIALHNNPEFYDLVAFLRDELDRVGPSNEVIAREYFDRSVALELDFFDEAYEKPYAGDGR